MSFRIKGLPAETFAHLFALSDEELAKQGAVRRIADDRGRGIRAASASPTPSPATNCCW